MEGDAIDLRLMAVVTLPAKLADTLQLTKEPQQLLITHEDVIEMRRLQRITVVPLWPAHTPAATEGHIMRQQSPLIIAALQPTEARLRLPPAASLTTGMRRLQALANTGVPISRPRSSVELLEGRVIAEGVPLSRLSHSSVAVSRLLPRRRLLHLRDAVANALRREGDLRQMMRRCL